MTGKEVVYQDGDGDRLELDTTSTYNCFFTVNDGMPVLINRDQAKLIRKQLKKFIKSGEEQDVQKGVYSE